MVKAAVTGARNFAAMPVEQQAQAVFKAGLSTLASAPMALLRTPPGVAGGGLAVQSEVAALRRIAANQLGGSPMTDLRLAYQQARGQVDFAHIEADVRLFANGKYQAQGGHFYNSPMIHIVGPETVGSNGVVRSRVNLLGPDGNWYLKNNSAGNISSLTPSDWSLARAKAEMSQAWVNRTLSPKGEWTGISNGVEFRFYPPLPNIPGWRGYPLQKP